MGYTIRKQTCADGQVYRYHVSDQAGHLRYVAEPVGRLLPLPTRLVEFFDPDHNPVGRIQPPEVAPWQRGERYEVFIGSGSGDGERQAPRAVIWGRWRLVDVLLLHLPRYEVQLGAYLYIVEGSRYGERFYEIFRLCGEEEGEKARELDEERAERQEADEDEEEPKPKQVKVGQIQRPTAGPSYIVETSVAPLRQAPLVLTALAILIDMDLHA